MQVLSLSLALTIFSLTPLCNLFFQVSLPQNHPTTQGNQWTVDQDKHKRCSCKVFSVRPVLLPKKLLSMLLAEFGDCQRPGMDAPGHNMAGLRAHQAWSLHQVLEDKMVIKALCCGGWWSSWVECLLCLRLGPMSTRQTGERNYNWGKSRERSLTKYHHGQNRLELELLTDFTPKKVRAEQ